MMTLIVLYYLLLHSSCSFGFKEEEKKTRHTHTHTQSQLKTLSQKTLSSYSYKLCTTKTTTTTTFYRWQKSFAIVWFGFAIQNTWCKIWNHKNTTLNMTFVIFWIYDLIINISGWAELSLPTFPTNSCEYFGQSFQISQQIREIRFEFYLIQIFMSYLFKTFVVVVIYLECVWVVHI